MGAPEANRGEQAALGCRSHAQTFTAHILAIESPGAGVMLSSMSSVVPEKIASGMPRINRLTDLMAIPERDPNFRPSGPPIRGPADLKGQFVSKPS